MENLSEARVNSMSKEERQKELDRLEDLMCNTDYTTSDGAIIYDIYERSANLLIRKLDGEY